MSDRHVLDVRELPVYAFGRRDPLWWGVVLLMAIEGTGFALVLGSYFYIRNKVDVWPPTPLDVRSIVAGSLTMGAALVSVYPSHRVNVAAYAGDLKRIQRWQLLATLATLVVVALRVYELCVLPVRWDTNVYGSLLWGSLALHTTHVSTGLVENCVLLTLFYKGPVERKHLVDAEVNGLYWYFVVFAWLPLYAVLYLEWLVQ
jgi:cytochrome c oxidase subunit 3